jgi:putative nucleotidyltransferase with HDIG domain
MAEQRFALEWIKDNSTTDFDLYIKVQDHTIVYGSKGYHWFRQELMDLMSMGIREFYHRTEEEKYAKNYIKMATLPQIDKNLAPKERILSIQEIGAEFTQYLHEAEITESCKHKAEVLAESLVGCILEDPTSVKALSGLGDRDQYTLVHSIRVAAYITAIAKQMGMTDEAKLKQLAVGGIFHDVGKKAVPKELITKAGVLTDAEWKIMRSHPELGKKEMDQSKLDFIQKEIILHHHEKIDGSGYPHGLTKASLLPEVQIAVVADIFDALSSSRSYQQKRTRYEALDFMKHKLLDTEIDREAFRGLVACLM